MKNRMIFLIEDEPDIRESLREVLEMEGYEVSCAPNGFEATEILRDLPTPELILLDMLMPVMNGKEFRAWQLDVPRLKSVPVIVLSGISGPQPKTECFALGADAYFEKPIAPEVLQAAVSARLHRSVEHRREEAAINAPSPVDEIVAGDEGRADISARRIRLQHLLAERHRGWRLPFGVQPRIVGVMRVGGIQSPLLFRRMAP